MNIFLGEKSEMLFNPITSEDHLNRIEKAKKMMQEKDIDLLIVFSDNFHIGNCRYLTGIKPSQGWEPTFEEGYGTEIVTITQKGEPILWVNEMMVPWVKEHLACIGVGDETWINVQPWTKLNHGLAELGKENRNIAYEGRDITPWPIYEGIRNTVKKELMMADVTKLLRRIKSQKEIKLLEVASRINDIICDELVNGVIRCGITEKEVNRKICEIAYSLGAETCDANFMIDDDLGWGHPTDKVIEDKTLLSLHVILSYEGYYSDNDRVFGFGNISEEDRELARACKLSLEAGLKAIKPGIIGQEAMDAAWAAHEWADHSKWSLFVGHSIGVEGEEDGLWKDWTLEKDMVLCFSPGAYRNGKTWATEDVIHVTNNGVRQLTKFPVDHIIQL